LNLLEIFSKVNTFVFDVDGVMTNGGLLIMPDGHYMRTMNIKDGYALQLAVKKGYNVFVITGSHSSSVADRLKYLGIREFHQNIRNKKECLQSLIEKYNISAETTLFMGDDMPDIEAMKHVAVNACPADACIDVLSFANYISPYKGGEGCVRDVIEKILKLQQNWGDAQIKSV
jgi:3-deoxy-D-manno-octulosonate 8-phosphate phosphatase (KDO 8-P phosphatase)